MSSKRSSPAVALNTKPSFGFLICLPLLLSLVSPIVVTANAQEEPSGLTPTDIWSEDYASEIFPWAPENDRDRQFKEYHSYETTKELMLQLEQENPDIFEFHEGLLGGTNARGEQVTADTYEGWYYGYSSPWMKITGDVGGGEYNEFVGDSGNYADRHDVMIVGNHHAREWMSYTVALMQLEVIAFSYDNIGYDNDGDGLVDEDPWGDANNDGILDDDGDCLSLAAEFQDSNKDGNPCGPGDLGVDEDYSEQLITDLVNTREIYLIPMLNVDGNIYDREVFCPAPAWESCPSGGWRKNLRNNGPDLLPDFNEQVDEDCDGVDLNRNYQYEWGAPLGATVPLIPGTCTPSEDERAGITNNDVYTGPFDTRDNDGDGLINEDNVDGEDDDNDGQTDEDWAGGNSEPETRFIQDLTEMNDDVGDGASEFKATLTHHSYSELILYPWGHCTGCETSDHDQLVYHGDKMAEMTDYTNMQSSDLYPTTGDFCDWHYGVHGSYCYTSEIGTAFHQHEDDIDHIAVRNLGTGFYMAQIADNPRERADLGIANISQNQYIQMPDMVNVPSKGYIPVDMCVANGFAYSLNEEVSYAMYRTVKPSRAQSDYGPREWSTTAWSKAPFEDTTSICTLLSGENGTVIRSNLPIKDTVSGEVHYKAMLGTLGGGDLYQYPTDGDYYVLTVEYRADYGTFGGALFMFLIVASFVWGGLAICLRMMLTDGEEKEFMDALIEEDGA
ncbi:MAG: M14 family zinc carboxypeptidase [Candidatus Poseidoniaceae archaeon]|nr:M14 family zinc carboxypeptidase [Candidatus Poseidoniaceae archaeon]